MTRILGFLFDTIWGRGASLAVLAAAVVGAFVWDQRNIGARDGRAELQQEINEADDRLASAALAARAAADRPGALERLRAFWCRDC